MQQFELDIAGEKPFEGLVRARDAADAVRRALGWGPDREVEIVETGDLRAWMRVRVDGVPLGRVREHHRMRFRRD